jgi:hypothetical protein
LGTSGNSTFKEASFVNKRTCSNLNCRQVWREDQPEFEDGYCSMCGWELETIVQEEKQQEQLVQGLEEVEQIQQEETQQEEKQAPPSHDEDTTYVILTKENKLIFKEDQAFEENQKETDEEDPYHDYSGTRVVIYHESKPYRTVPIVYDEMIIGRENMGETPDIDLTSIDTNYRISRKHALIYRNGNGYHIRNLSQKNSLYVNGVIVRENQDFQLQNEMTIVLSNEYGLIFYEENAG